MYRTVKTDIWRDPWFLDLSPQSKCLFMYLFTNQSVSACGSMEIALSQIAFETKIPIKRIEAELVAFGDRVAWWPEYNLIVVRNFYRHQKGQSNPENFMKAAKKALADLPDAAKAWVTGVYPELADTHTQPIPIPSPTHGYTETATVTATESVTAEASETAPEEIFPAEFVAFWDRYPKGHGSRSKSYQAWRKVRKEHADIMAGLDAWWLSERWQKGMVKTAEIWLRDRLWENPAPPGPDANGFVPGSGDEAVRRWRENGGAM